MRREYCHGFSVWRFYFRNTFTSTYSETLRYAVVSPYCQCTERDLSDADIVFVIKEAGKYLIVSENKDSEAVMV